MTQQYGLDSAAFDLVALPRDEFVTVRLPDGEHLLHKSLLPRNMRPTMTTPFKLPLQIVPQPDGRWMVSEGSTFVDYGGGARGSKCGRIVCIAQTEENAEAVIKALNREAAGEKLAEACRLLMDHDGLIEEYCGTDETTKARDALAAWDAAGQSSR